MRNLLLHFLFCLLLLSSPMSFLVAQDGVPADVSALVNKPVDDVHAALQSMGYEIATSNVFAGGHQQWWNERTKSCVALKIKKKMVEEITTGNDGECIAGVENARKVWDAYHDGPSDITSAALEKERAALREAGFQPTYWIREAAAGRSMEKWYNSTTSKCKYLAFNTGDGGDVAKGDNEPDQCTNPAPKR
ncbi:MAG TPA: hypothetical protein PKE21_12410 [Flavobacteriales bacterium]|nr:hypothetical protein [Flavobacteriales bacterium]HMR28277.1 hypothetical protein [Flavobacteriales bacterium]